MEVMERIKHYVEDNSIMLFMKGTPDFPQCGFSSKVVQVLKAVRADFAAVNVLEDPEVRANLPAYANWPTFPQLYVKGELIGGCDITMEMFQSGELQQLVDEALGRQSVETTP